MAHESQRVRFVKNTNSFAIDGLACPENLRIAVVVPRKILVFVRTIAFVFENAFSASVDFEQVLVDLILQFSREIQEAEANILICDAQRSDKIEMTGDRGGLIYERPNLAIFGESL